VILVEGIGLGLLFSFVCFLPMGTMWSGKKILRLMVLFSDADSKGYVIQEIQDQILASDKLNNKLSKIFSSNYQKIFNC